MKSLVISGSVSVAQPIARGIEDWQFIRLQSTAPGDIPDEYELELTRGKVVEIFAKLFDKESCGRTNPANAYSGPVQGSYPQDSAAAYLLEKYSGSAGAQRLAAEFGLGDLCLPDTINDGGEIKRKVYLHASSDFVFENYSIVSHDSVLSKPSYNATDIYLRIEFANTSYVPIYYFIDTEKLRRYKIMFSADDLYDWRGSVRDSSGNKVDNPSFEIKNNRIFFPGNWSGIIVFKRLPIRYHLYTVTISGTLDGESTRHYDGRVSAVAPGLKVVDLDISEEETAEETKNNCPWLDFTFRQNSTGTGTTTSCGNCLGGQTGGEEPSALKEKPEDSVCTGTITAEEYNEECCGGPLPGCIPQCREIETTIYGPVHLDESSEYCGTVSRIVLLPSNGAPCGKMVKTWTTSGGCCPNPLQWSENNPTVIAPGGEVGIEVFGGEYDPPNDLINWVLSGGEGYTFSESGSTSYNGGRIVHVSASSDPCGEVEVIARDSCSEAKGTLTPTNHIVFSAASCNHLRPGSSCRVFVENGGRYPITFKVFGNGWHFSDGSTEITLNLYYVDVFCDQGTCSDGQVQAIDACGAALHTILNDHEPLSFSESSCTSLNPGSHCRVYVANGGFYPITFKVVGGGWHFYDGTTTKEVWTYYIDIYLDASQCSGDCTVEASDACSVASHRISNNGC